MLSYKRFSIDQVRALRKEPVLVHGLLALLSEQNMYRKPVQIRALRDINGGIKMDGADVVIKYGHIVNSSELHPQKPSLEEQAVRDAVDLLRREFKPPFTFFGRTLGEDVETTLLTILSKYVDLSLDRSLELIHDFRHEAEAYPLRSLLAMSDAKPESSVPPWERKTAPEMRT